MRGARSKPRQSEAGAAAATGTPSRRFGRLRCLAAVEWAARMADAGAGEILLTSMDRDGTKRGYDLALLRAVADRIAIPVIASGGGGSAEDLARALSDDPSGGHCQAALAASIFHFGETTVPEIKRRLLELGVPVRPPTNAVSR